MNMLQKISGELPSIQRIKQLKKEIDSHRPFEDDLEQKVLQKLRLDWNYHTNAIEGNSYTRGETISLLMQGITANNKPIRDGLEIQGHNRAIDIIMSLIKEDRKLNETDIRSLHKIILGEDYYNPAKTNEGNPTRKLIKGGVYKTTPNHVKTITGEIHYYASVEETPVKMKELVDWYNKMSLDKKINPIVLAALFHHKFVAIHPFDDGNGRMTRLLTNFVLLKFGYPISVIKQENRKQYYATLAQADNGEVIPIVELISETVENSLDLYSKVIRGEGIMDDDDIDKEISLFIKGIDKYKNGVSEKNDIDIVRFINDLLEFPSLKFRNLSKAFNIFNENLKMYSGKKLIASFDCTNRVLYNTLEKSRIEISLADKVSYKITFGGSLLGDKSKTIKIRVDYYLNKMSYSISNNLDNMIEKSYSQEIKDDLYNQFIGKSVNYVIKEVKSN